MSKQQKANDSRIWCEECKKSDYTTVGDKYLCTSCGKSLHLNHEVHHEIFPHVVGDTGNLS